MLRLSSVYDLARGICNNEYEYRYNNKPSENIKENENKDGYYSNDEDYDIDESDDDENDDDRILNNLQCCNSDKIIELTLQRDFLLVTLQQFVDAHTELEAKAALLAMECFVNKSKNVENLLKFLVRAGAYQIIHTAVTSTTRFTKEDIAITKPDDDDDDDDDEVVDETHEVSRQDEMIVIAKNDSNNDEKEEQKNDDTTIIPSVSGTATTTMTTTTMTTTPKASDSDSGGRVGAGLSPSIAYPMLHKLSYYYEEREKRRRQKQQTKKTRIKSLLAIPRRSWKKRTSWSSSSN